MRYIVKMRKPGGRLSAIGQHYTMERALDEVKYMHSLEEEGFYEYVIDEKP